MLMKIIACTPLRSQFLNCHALRLHTNLPITICYRSHIPWVCILRLWLSTTVTYHTTAQHWRSPGNTISGLPHSSRNMVFVFMIFPIEQFVSFYNMHLVQAKVFSSFMFSSCCFLSVFPLSLSFIKTAFPLLIFLYISLCPMLR